MPRAVTETGEDRCPWHDTLVETLGKSGKNGRVGNLEKAMAETKKELKAVKAVQLRLIIYTALAAGGSAAGASLAVKILHG